ncbi:AI-2E family transporter [Saccharopolyspora rhizosphaerae]|uniref:AI-2E family transporter n=1 Tax=Saccharopolyspora rhizosphaerae TaxID=2492662 RepID=A0A3R8NXL9_9PSEU|nr:AI-2E family transporter [Saccharopolyspora rhizosphaerae]RRO15435.1 AI-2E family transporter [Saccharopolyspora rhizosphaerae]
MFTGVAVAVGVVVFVVLVARPLLIPLVVMIGAATIAEPLVARLARMRVPRALGAAAVCLLVLAALGIVVLVFTAGIVSQWDAIVRVATSAVSRARDLLAGVSFGPELVDQVSAAAAGSGDSLALGVVSQLSSGLTALAVGVLGVLVGVYVLVLVLADAPRIHALISGGVPGPRGYGVVVTERAATIARQYFKSLTAMAVMNSAVLVLGAAVMRVPFVLAIGLLSFVTAYIPYVGAFLSGAFAVLMALGSGGLETGLAMLGVVVLANAVLENFVRPFTFGAVLDLHPLIILLVTLVGGALGGAVGMVVAPPLTAIVAESVRLLHAARPAARAPAPREGG